MRYSLAFIFKYINKKGWFLLGYFALILECLTPIIAILLQQDLIDKVFIGKQYDKFNRLILLYGIFFFGPKLWFTVRKVTFFHISYNLQMSLTNAFLFKIYNMPNEISNKEHSGKLLNHMRNDIFEASDLAINKLLSDLVLSVITIVLLSILLVKLNFIMLLIVVFVAIIYYILLNIFGEKTKEFSQRVKEQKGKVSITVEESISAIREIVAYNSEDWQLKRYEEKFSDYFKACIKEGVLKVRVLFVSEPFLYGTKLIVILFGAISVISNKISLGGFVVSFTLVDQLVVELGKLFEQVLRGEKLIASVDCIKSVMDKECKEFGSAKFNDDIKTIRFKDVTFSYSDDLEPVLNNLSIDFPVGKKIAIVGESGSGKSTIAQLLLRAYSPDKGEVCINDLTLNSYGQEYTDKISVVFQEPHFIPSSIRENLVFDKEYDSLHIEKVCNEMLCHDFIEGFQNRYETQVGERGASLSGGQKQRLALSRAILKNTDLLILDEATSALDNETEFAVQKNIDKLRKGKTTIIIAHRISTIQNSDIIYVLDKGTVVSKGTHEELMKESPIYKRLYNVKKVS